MPDFSEMKSSPTHSELRSCSQHSSEDDSSAESSVGKGDLDLRFGFTFTTVCLCSLLSGWALTSIASALPIVAQDLGGLTGINYVWAVSAYAITSMVFIPISANIAEVFDIFNAVLMSLGLFSLGSILCGCAKNIVWLAVARAVQGLGGSGLLLYPAVVLADLVPLQRRALSNTVLCAIYATAAAVSPLVGSAFAEAGAWRWIFFMTLPFSAVTLVFTCLSLRMRASKPMVPLSARLVNLDWTGCLLMTIGSLLTGIALTYAGLIFAWKSSRVLTPLIVGIYLIVLAILLGGCPSRIPLIPRSIFLNLTTISGTVQHFLNWFLLLGTIYYVPFYYQYCHKDLSLTRSDVSSLAIGIPVGLGTILATISLTITKAPRVHCCIGWLVSLIGYGLMTTLQQDTHLPNAIFSPVIVAIGGGFLSTATEFPVLAPLPVADHTRALTFHTFVQALGGLLGMSVGASLLQGGLVPRLSRASPSLIDATTPFYGILPIIHSFDDATKVLIQDALGSSLRAVWHAMFGVTLVGLLSCALMRQAGTSTGPGESDRMGVRVGCEQEQTKQHV